MQYFLTLDSNYQVEFSLGSYYLSKVIEGRINLVGVCWMAEEYNDSSIKSLKGAERVRKRPGVMFGSDDINGAFHTLKEIIANSLDESRAGHGKNITVKYHADGSISVLDTGRGVPMDWNIDEQRFNWDLIFNELYAGGKYDEENGDYEFSLGLNGLGSAATQYASEWMHVISWRKDKVYKKDFAKGAPTDADLVIEPNTSGKTGSLVHWKIDNEVFPDTDFSAKMFKELLESQAHLNAVDLLFIDEHTGEEVNYHGIGIEAYLKEQLGDKVIDVLVKSKDSSGTEKGKKYRAKGEIVLAITNETKSKQLHFHNTATMRSGVHGSAFDYAVTAFFKDIAKQYGVSIIPYDYQDYLSVLSSTYSNITSFANQTKDGVSNNFIFDLVNSTVLDMLQEAVAMKKESVTSLIENVVTAANARKKAKEIEQLERQASKLTSKRREKAEKFVDCSSKDPSEKELFIVEGDSAKGSCKNARDRRFQALLPVKGKPMNALKATISDLLENQEIRDIINTIGAGIDIPVEGVELFDINKCEFAKIIFTTDADVDGNQIRVLLYTIFYRLMPKLLEAGMVYVAETPLFELVTNQKDKNNKPVSMFAYSVEEKETIIEDCKKNRIAIVKINRSKGLGQNNPDMLRMTTMSPETRRLVPLTIDINDPVVRDISNMLFGEDVNKERKGFIFSLLEEKLGEDAGLGDLIETIEALEQEDTEEVEDTAVVH